jgi:hypothetical protein
MDYITMSKREIKRYDVIKKLISKEINGTEGAELLGLTVRHIKRLKAKVGAKGVAGLEHASRGKTGNRKIPEQEKQKIIRLLHKQYADFKPGFATEKLSEKHNITRDPKTIRQIMIEERLWKPKRQKRKTHRAWRQRKAHFGEMIQFDGSYEHWLEDRGDTGEMCLLAAIDDATGIVTKAKFATDEGVFPVFAFWKEYIGIHGTPYSIYVDKFSTYKMKQRVAEENHDTKTQFERAMSELCIEPITAHSSQAKGRVERLFSTLQDRLIKEMRLCKISTVAEANTFLEKEFLPTFNARFSVEPRSKANLHKKIQRTGIKKMESILCRQYQRTVRNDWTVSYKKQWYQLSKEQPVTVCKKDRITVEERLDSSIHFRLRGKYVNYEVLPERAKKVNNTRAWVLAAGQKQTPKPRWKPPAKHPWKRQFIYTNKLVQTVQV